MTPEQFLAKERLHFFVLKTGLKPFLNTSYQIDEAFLDKIKAELIELKSSSPIKYKFVTSVAGFLLAITDIALISFLRFLYTKYQDFFKQSLQKLQRVGKYFDKAIESFYVALDAIVPVFSLYISTRLGFALQYISFFTVSSSVIKYFWYSKNLEPVLTMIAQSLVRNKRLSPETLADLLGVTSKDVNFFTRTLRRIKIKLLKLAKGSKHTKEVIVQRVKEHLLQTKRKQATLMLTLVDTFESLLRLGLFSLILRKHRQFRTIAFYVTLVLAIVISYAKTFLL